MTSISSSNHFWQNWSKTHAYIAERMFFPRNADDIAAAKAAGVAWAGVWKKAADAVFRAWVDAGLRVIAYTVDDHEERDHLMGLGVQGVFSDNPLALMAGLPHGQRCVY